MSVKLAGKLLTQKRFMPLFALFQTGTFNDNALKNALIALVLTGGVVLFSPDMPVRSVVPLAAILFTGPFLILCAIAGQIADKYDRGLILKSIKRAEVFIMILASIGFLLSNAFILCLALVCMGAQSAFFSPTKNAVLPQWLEADELITGNGLLSGVQFFTILLGTIFGTLAFRVLPSEGLLTAPRIISGILMTLAFIGWYAAERVPAAPAPRPDLKIDFNPLSAIYSVLKFAWADKPVFRPMLGIAWFYGLSTIMITALPDYIYNVMNYDLAVLSAIQASSTIAILIGSLLCVILAKGREALGFVTIGIIGVTLFSLDLYFGDNSPSHVGQASLDVFLKAPNTPRFMMDIFGASLCAGLFVIPLQAMAQNRSNPLRRARLMAAGAVMLNLSVNVFTLMLAALGLEAISAPPNIPFLIISCISAIVAVYSILRFIQIRKENAAANH